MQRLQRCHLHERVEILVGQAIAGQADGGEAAAQAAAAADAPELATTRSTSEAAAAEATTLDGCAEGGAVEMLTSRAQFRQMEDGLRPNRKSAFLIKFASDFQALLPVCC